MGYSTEFRGELKFTGEATVKQIVALRAICGQDCREHPEWKTSGLYHVDLEVTENMDGLKWSGAEKTHEMDGLVNLVLRLMRAEWPDFGLAGEMLAQGEDIEDRWALVIENGQARKREIAIAGKVLECPECGHRFELEG